LFWAKFVFAREVTKLSSRGAARILMLSDGREIVSKAVIIATGAKYRSLDIPQLERFGRNILYATFNDPRLVRDLDVAVTVGGNSAGQAAIHLAKFARRVTLGMRGNSLNKDMPDYLVTQIRATPNIDVRISTDVIGGDGRDRLEHITVRDKVRNVVDMCQQSCSSRYSELHRRPTGWTGQFSAMRKDLSARGTTLTWMLFRPRESQ
jgi:thioredoxin reductase (NADPH)